MFRSSKHTIGARKGTNKSTRALPFSCLSSVLCWLLPLSLILYVYVTSVFLAEHTRASEGARPSTTSAGKQNKSLEAKNFQLQKHDEIKQRMMWYEDWKEMAVKLSGLEANKILETLDDQDPFGVRKFEAQLVDAESKKGANLDQEELKGLFPCPSYRRITIPDQRAHARDEAFRRTISSVPLTEETRLKSVFLFFQHLRKAGGTEFCTLAQKNLLRPNVPSYYCMPDMYWSDKRCAGCITKYSNSEIVTNMREKDHLILGNEWDPFDHSRFFDLPAIFATSFRKPLHRALSQFRFECIEDRVSFQVYKMQIDPLAWLWFPPLACAPAYLGGFSL